MNAPAVADDGKSQKIRNVQTLSGDARHRIVSIREDQRVRLQILQKENEFGLLVVWIEGCTDGCVGYRRGMPWLPLDH
jgi:hypothetical protein